MNPKAEAAVWGAFAADTLALGAHWIYDTDRIAQAFRRVSEPVAPLPGSYHPNRGKGEFTHYGDQTLVLLRSLAARKAFDLDDFGARWLELFTSGYTGYVDGATRGALANFSFDPDPRSTGSGSNDLAGAARFAPLLLLDLPPDKLIAAAVAQTKMTHNKTEVLNSAEFFAWTAQAVIGGLTPSQALAEAAGRGYPQPLAQWYEMGVAAASEDPVEAIGRLGQTCHTPDAFPGCVALILRYEGDLAEALIQNVMAGGDSAARGLIVGAILGAHLGREAIPAGWIGTMRAAGEIAGLLESLR